MMRPGRGPGQWVRWSRAAHAAHGFGAVQTCGAATQAGDTRRSRCHSQVPGHISAPIANVARIAEIGRLKNRRMLPSDLIGEVTKTPKKKMGRPATGRDPIRTFRLSDEKVAEIDAWAARQPDKPPRSEALRRLIDLGIEASNSRGSRSKR